MIPAIEDILDDLIAGAITKEQAFKWIDQHIDLAKERGYEARDREA